MFGPQTSQCLKLLPSFKIAHSHILQLEPSGRKHVLSLPGHKANCFITKWLSLEVVLESQLFYLQAVKIPFRLEHTQDKCTGVRLRVCCPVNQWFSFKASSKDCTRWKYICNLQYDYLCRPVAIITWLQLFMITVILHKHWIPQSRKFLKTFFSFISLYTVKLF